MSDSGILKPGQKIKTVTTTNEVESLVKSLYAFDNFTIVELNGYDDKNYKISVRSLENDTETEYTFKILNSLDSKNIALVEAQNDIMFFLNNRNYTCPKPVKNKFGTYFSVESFVSGHHVVRLLTYIPGTILYKTKPTPKTFYEIGREVGNLNVVLKDFEHIGVNNRKTIWTFESVPLIRQYLFAIKDNYKRSVFENIITEFEKRVLKIVDSLEKGVIHGDINEQNLLTEYVNGDLVLTGLLDFGDISRSCYIFELAIAVTYMMIMSKSIETAGYVIAGYSKVRTVSNIELSILKMCTMARICQSYILGMYSSLQEPDNAYLLVSAENGWAILQELLRESEEETLQNWLTIANNYSKTADHS
ncbi:hypothetical protein FQR65_LT02421 [Abscondita terminalis]|nr:hypothetical protein FQR65_LT02421 [Abscondita terminalis]